MMQQQQQPSPEQKLQAQVDGLKIRIFDMGEQMQASAQEIQSFAQAVCQVSDIPVTEGLNLDGIIQQLQAKNAPKAEPEALDVPEEFQAQE